MEGYAKRYGASYTDYFSGNFFGNAVLPSLLHEDPRYYQKGHRQHRYPCPVGGWKHGMVQTR